MLSKYSFGIGDRFTHQGKYQLKAFIEAEKAGVNITPVWNKSYREHTTVGSKPDSVLGQAQKVTKELNWKHSFAVDADHITLETVDEFIPHSNFFTVDVANYIGKKADQISIDLFIKRIRSLFLDELKIRGLDKPLNLTISNIREVANKFLFAIQHAAKICEYIKSKKGDEPFLIEISMDEVEVAQTPVEIFLILHMIVQNQIPITTLAPKFTGRFNKGVDYEGDLKKFESEFEDCLILMKYGVQHLGMNSNQKLSVHTGSDKFSLYPIINKLIKKHRTGLHLKTAGTTWLEEMIGLAEAGGPAFEMAKSIYKESLERYDELTGPYQTVLNIDLNKLPTAKEIDTWSGTLFCESLRHVISNSTYNPSFRQLIHTSYKVAAERGNEFYGLLKDNEEIIGKNVYENIFFRHIKPLFID